MYRTIRMILQYETIHTIHTLYHKIHKHLIKYIKNYIYKEYIHYKF